MTHDNDGYEENPWADDPPGKLVPVTDFLPPADIIRRSIAHVSANGMLLFSLPPDDMKLLELKAARSGINASDLITGVLHDYAIGQLVKRTEL